MNEKKEADEGEGSKTKLKLLDNSRSNARPLCCLSCLHVYIQRFLGLRGVYWVGFYYCDASQNGRKASISCSTALYSSHGSAGLRIVLLRSRRPIQQKKILWCFIRYFWQHETIAIDARFPLVFLPTPHINLLLRISFYERRVFFFFYNDQYFYDDDIDDAICTCTAPVVI